MDLEMRIARRMEAVFDGHAMTLQQQMSEEPRLRRRGRNIQLGIGLAVGHNIHRIETLFRPLVGLGHVTERLDDGHLHFGPVPALDGQGAE